MAALPLIMVLLNGIVRVCARVCVRVVAFPLRRKHFLSAAVRVEFSGLIASDGTQL